MVFESWMHLCCIYHQKLQGRPEAISRLWGAGALWVLSGSLAELAIMSVLWAQYWSSWETGMRIAMVLLHFGASRDPRGAYYELRCDGVLQLSWRHRSVLCSLALG